MTNNGLQMWAALSKIEIDDDSMVGLAGQGIDESSKYFYLTIEPKGGRLLRERGVRILLQRVHSDIYYRVNQTIGEDKFAGHPVTTQPERLIYLGTDNDITTFHFEDL